MCKTCCPLPTNQFPFPFGVLSLSFGIGFRLPHGCFCGHFPKRTSHSFCLFLWPARLGHMMKALHLRILYLRLCKCTTCRRFVPAVASIRARTHRDSVRSTPLDSHMACVDLLPRAAKKVVDELRALGLDKLLASADPSERVGLSQLYHFSCPLLEVSDNKDFSGRAF